MSVGRPMIRPYLGLVDRPLGGPRMRFVLAAAAALAALTAAFALPAGAHVATPGPQCGGTLWKLMTLSDTGKSAVQWAPAATSIPHIPKLTEPAKITPLRGAAFPEHVCTTTPLTP